MDDLDLAPGVRRLRPDDHFMILSETDASPMHVGALLVLEREGSDPGYGARLRDHLVGRLAGTPLLARLVEAPDGYDSDVWADVAQCDSDYHFTIVAEPVTAVELKARTARLAQERLDLRRPPFRAYIFERLEDEAAVAVYLKMHHSVADGIGFQQVLRQLSDQATAPAARSEDATLPTSEVWRAAADARFAALAQRAGASSARRKAAVERLKAIEADPATRRAETPQLKMASATSAERRYDCASFALERFRALGHALGGTVNDVFVAVAATAIRELLLALDDHPDLPLVANSARSYRREEHGAYGNRIVALNPQLATDCADPRERLRTIQASMEQEKARSEFEEALLDQPERPFGARDRRARFAERTSGGARLLAGNVTLSNVPGPAETLSYAGLRQRANYPVPIIGSGRFLNITARRNADMLDIGFMADPTRLTNAEQVVAQFAAALALYEGLPA